MALTISNVGTYTSTSSGATLDLTGITAAVGDWLVLAVAADNAGTSGVSSTSASITDAAGNTWTRQSETNRTPGAASNDGCTLSIWTTKITNALSASTVTVNFSPNTTAKAAALKRVEPASGEAVKLVSVGAGVTGSGLTFSSGNVSVDNGYTIFGAVAVETSTAIVGDSDTTNGSWSTNQTATADTGTNVGSVGVALQRKTVSASGNQSYDASIGGVTNRDYALNWIVLCAQSMALAATDPADTAAFDATLVLPAALAAVEAPDVAAFAATLVLPATLAATEAPDVAAFSATIVLEIALAATERPDTAAFVISPVWPDALPLPTIAGYGLQPAVPVRRMAQEIGAARVYRTGKQPLAEVAVTWQLSAWQQLLLDGFYRSLVDEGGHWFGVTLAFPSGLALVSARFKDKLSMSALGGRRWRVSGTLEVMQRPVMTEAALTALLDDDGDPPAWPADRLPLPTQDSWTLEPHPAVVRSEDLPGLPRQRRRSRNSVTEVSTRWELDAEQAAVFDAFFRWRGRDGAQWFDFPVYGGIGFVETSARFLGEADWTPRAGGRWSVVAPIEVREREVISADEYAWLVGEDPDELFAAVQALHSVVSRYVDGVWS